MELKRAKEVLEAIEASLNTAHIKSGAHFPIVQGNTERVRLNGTFEYEELIAIATWMRDPEGVVKA